MTRRQERPDRVELILRGAIDVASHEDLLSAGRAALSDDECRELVLDFAGVTFLDSHGLGALIELRTVAKDHYQRILLRRIPTRVQRLLQITGLDQGVPA